MKTDAPRATHFWLMKSEPDVYSIEDLKRDQQTLWTGVRNYQARNYMMGSAGLAQLAKTQKTTKKATTAPQPPTMESGDHFLFYHSNAEPPGCVGVGRIEKVGQPDPEQFLKKSEGFEPKASKEKPMWFCAEVSFEDIFKRAVPLDELREDKVLAKMVLLQKGSRLSVQPVSKAEFDHIVALGAAAGAAPEATLSAKTKSAGAAAKSSAKTSARAKNKSKSVSK